VTDVGRRTKRLQTDMAVYRLRDLRTNDRLGSIASNRFSERTLNLGSWSFFCSTSDRQGARLNRYF
jgi:hypothetical protein